MHWSRLLSNLTAAIFGAIAAGVVVTVYFLIKSRWGNKVIVEHTSQALINAGILDIQYHNQPIENLVLNTFRVRNNGAGVIEHFTVGIDTVPIGIKNTFLAATHSDKMNNSKVEVAGNKITVEREYLNPIKKFGTEEIELAVFSDTRLDFSVIGGGKNWSVDFKEKGKTPPAGIFLSTTNISLVLLAWLLSVTLDYLDFGIIVSIMTLLPISGLIAYRIFHSSKNMYNCSLWG